MNFHSRSYSESITPNGVIRTHLNSEQSLERLFNPTNTEASVPLRERNLPSSFFNPNCIAESTNARREIEPDSTSQLQSSAQAPAQQQTFTSYHQRNYSSPSFMFNNNNQQPHQQPSSTPTVHENLHANGTSQMMTRNTNGNGQPYNRVGPQLNQDPQPGAMASGRAPVVEPQVGVCHQQSNVRPYNSMTNNSTNHSNNQAQIVRSGHNQHSSCQQVHTMTPGYVHEPVHSHSVQQNAQPQHHFRCQSMIIGPSSVNAASQNGLSNPANTNSIYQTLEGSGTGDCRGSQGSLQNSTISSNIGLQPTRNHNNQPQQASSLHQRNFSSPAFVLNSNLRRSGTQQFTTQTQFSEHGNSHMNQAVNNTSTQNSHQHSLFHNHNSQHHQDQHQPMLIHENAPVASQFRHQAQNQRLYSAPIETSSIQPIHANGNTPVSNYNNANISSPHDSQFVMSPEFIANNEPLPIQVSNHDTFHHSTCATYNHDHIVQLSADHI